MNIIFSYLSINLGSRFTLLGDRSKPKPGLDEFIQRIFSIQSDTKTHSFADTSSTLSGSSVSSVQFNAYDVTYTQAYLLSYFRNLSSLSLPRRNQFIWLSDMFANLDQFHIRRAQMLNPRIFSQFFGSLLLILLKVPAINEISTYFARVGFTMDSCCFLKRATFSQQLQFICSPRTCVFTGIPLLTQIQVIQKAHPRYLQRTNLNFYHSN